MKFYFVELTHKKSGHIFYKFGITQNKDVLNRFTNIYPEREGYQNFNIRVLYSENLDKNEAKKKEKEFLSRYTNIPNIPSIVKDGFDYNSRNTSGITEWRVLNTSQKNELLRKLYESK